MADDTITVNFSLSDTGTSGTHVASSALADFQADYVSNPSSAGYQEDQLLWSGAVTNGTGCSSVTSSDGTVVDACSTLAVNFPDGAVLHVIVNNTVDWNLVPTISFLLTQGPTGSGGGGTTGAPEPASLALLGTALAGIGLIRRRRRGV